MNEEEIQGYTERFERKRKGKMTFHLKKHSKKHPWISGHALARYGQRFGPCGALPNEAEEALRGGKQWFQLPPGPIQDEVRFRSPFSGRLVLYHGGKVYVFGTKKKSGRRDLITVYSLHIDETAAKSEGEGNPDGQTDG